MFGLQPFKDVYRALLENEQVSKKEKFVAMLQEMFALTKKKKAIARGWQSQPIPHVDEHIALEALTTAQKTIDSYQKSNTSIFFFIIFLNQKQQSFPVISFKKSLFIFIFLQRNPQ